MDRCTIAERPQDLTRHHTAATNGHGSIEKPMTRGQEALHRAGIRHEICVEGVVGPFRACQAPAACEQRLGTTEEIHVWTKSRPFIHSALLRPRLSQSRILLGWRDGREIPNRSQ
jgi:hypothetical protein